MTEPPAIISARPTKWVGALLSVITIIAILTAGAALYRAESAVNDQREGRRIAVTAICSSIGAVIDAGRATILSGSVIRPREFEINLRRLGLPPESVREQGASSAADAYSRAIARRIALQTGNPSLIEPDGTLDCDVLRDVSRTEAP